MIKMRDFRLKEYIITFLCVITLNFFIPRLMPGDPFTFLSSEEGQVNTSFSQEDIERYKEYYGLDKPLIKQYSDYILKLFRGNLGYSIAYKEEVLTIIKRRISWTLFLVIISTILSSIVGVILGSISAYLKDSFIDKFLYLGFIILSETPSFLIGLLLMFYFAAKLKLFPLSGGMTLFIEFSSTGEKIYDILHHATLPVISLTVTGAGSFYLLARNSMIHILEKDYIRTARGKGLGKVRVIFVHAFKNAMPPVITRILLSLGSVLGGGILVENLFKYPGIGSLMREAVFLRDYPLIQGIFVVMTIFVLSMNYIADIIYKKLDPRVN